MLAKAPKRSRGRPKLYETRIMMSVTYQMLDAIDRVLDEDETRLDLIRIAIERELKRRHQR